MTTYNSLLDRIDNKSVMASDSKVPIFYLTEDMKNQFTKTRDLLDSILETFEILEDPELMNRIKQSSTDFEIGETISFDQLKEELSNES